MNRKMTPARRGPMTALALILSFTSSAYAAYTITYTGPAGTVKQGDPIAWSATCTWGSGDTAPDYTTPGTIYLYDGNEDDSNPVQNVMSSYYVNRPGRSVTLTAYTPVTLSPGIYYIKAHFNLGVDTEYRKITVTSP